MSTQKGLPYACEFMRMGLRTIPNVLGKSCAPPLWTPFDSSYFDLIPLDPIEFL